MSREDKIKLSPKDIEVLRHIRNTIMHTGKSPPIRTLQELMDYKSPRSITVILNRLMKKGAIARRSDGQLAITHEPKEQNNNASTIDVPLVGVASCGTPLLAEEHIQAKIPVSTQLAKPPHKYFLLRASGDSMNKAGINDGDMILVRQQISAENNDIVVAMVDSEVTIKKLLIKDSAVILEPCSTNNMHMPTILQKDFSVQGIVVQTLGQLNS